MAGSSSKGLRGKLSRGGILVYFCVWLFQPTASMRMAGAPAWLETPQAPSGISLFPPRTLAERSEKHRQQGEAAKLFRVSGFRPLPLKFAARKDFIETSPLKATKGLPRDTGVCAEGEILAKKAAPHQPRRGGSPSTSAGRRLPASFCEGGVEIDAEDGVQRRAALALRLEVLRKAKAKEEARSAFPVALRIPHPELVAGPLVSSLCVGTSLIGGNVMQDDDSAFKMLCSAYEEYGINFYDVGELDPLPHSPQHHGSGHSGVLRQFFRKYRGLGGSEGAPSSAAVATAAAAAAPEDEGALRAEAQRLCVSVRLLSGSVGPFDYERFALERKRREATACVAAQRHGRLHALGKSDGLVGTGGSWSLKTNSVRHHCGCRLALCPLLLMKALEAAVDGMLDRLGVDCIDLLQLAEPHRYVPRHSMGEDTYCWGLERPAEESVSIEEQLEMLSGLIRKGKVRYIGVSNETAYGVFKWVQAAEEVRAGRTLKLAALRAGKLGLF
ncbi:aldo keto related protein [Cyclospora cayetanensis]|uniref:Aldo keto related protein n=1 Tax=Cyclospora cayetanensis TaxID=88456 RepID=A0A1D3D024_9EIME|nr:aldo keto related protein [Cyclospora cayetanensis]